jgi:hypothetical protein
MKEGQQPPAPPAQPRKDERNERFEWAEGDFEIEEPFKRPQKPEQKKTP